MHTNIYKTTLNVEIFYRGGNAMNFEKPKPPSDTKGALIGDE